MAFPSLPRRCRIAAKALAIGTCLITAQSSGQSPAQTDQAIRTGDGMLSIQANLPEQVRMGEQFTYDVIVSNTSDNATLHEIELRHADQSSLTIESIDQPEQNNQPEGNASAQNQQQNAQQGDQDNASVQQAQDQQAQNQRRTRPPEPQSKFAQPENQRQQNRGFSGQQSADQSLTIASLQPGESKTFTVTASADKEGPVKSCLMITNYRPSICLQTTAIKPELKITKQSPERNQLCDVIELTYTVTNDGTGAVGKFEVRDDLTDGLRTIDDQDTLAFTVDQLKGGDTRKFVARVYATKPGDFRSRAYAKAVDSDLTARSENVGPEIVGAQLQVNVQGRNAVPSNTPAVFTATVTNTGQAPAENVQVAVHIPENANLRRMSDVQMQQSDPSQNANAQASNQSYASQGGNQVREAYNENRSAADRLTQGRQSSQQANRAGGDNADQKAEMQAGMRAEEFAIERLEPGQSAQFDYVVSARNEDKIDTLVVARSICSLANDQDVAYDATSEDTATASTRIVRLPGLQVYTLDDADPVEVGKPVTYTIRVKNEGDAPDQDIQITATLPEQMNFENADGPTESSQEGATVTFQPLDELKPGEEAEYTVTANVQSAGAAQLKVELVSQSFTSPVETAEPTRLYNPQGTTAGQ